MKRRLSSLPLQLFILLVLPLLLLLMGVALGSITLHRSAMRDTLSSHNVQIVSGTAASLSEQIEQRKMLLMELELNSSDSEDAAGQLKSPFDGGIALYTIDGQLLGATNQDEDWDGIWEASASGEAWAISQLIKGQNKTRLILTADQPPGQDDKEAVVAVGIVSLSKLGVFDILESLHAAEATSAYIIDSRGQILYHSDSSRTGDYVNPALYHEQVDYRRINDQEVIVTSASVSATDWVLVQEEDWQKTLSPMMRYSQAASLVLVPGLVLAMAAIWFGIQRIVYPLQRLENQATRLDWGDFAAIEQPAGGIKEIQQLQGTLRHMVQRIQKAQTDVHNYIGAITRAQEEERMRLAHELHDQTAQALVALNHRIQMLTPHVNNDPEAAQLVTETRAMIMQTIDDLRRIVRALRPIYLEELGLVPALEMLARDVAPNEQMSVEFQKSGTAQRLKPESEIALYRIAQEALNNAWQHSQASQVWLSVLFDEEFITVSVRDNGQGFEAPHHPLELTGSGQTHFGIMGMYERAALIGAHLQVKSGLDSGSTITVRTPIS